MGYGLSRSQQNELEKRLIAECRDAFGKHNVYNISDGGEGGDTWSSNPNKEDIRRKLKVPKSEEHKRKISSAHSGSVHVHSENCKCPFCKSKRGENVGRVYSAERNKKISLALSGKLFSDDHKLNLRKNHADCSGKRNSMFGTSYKWVCNAELRIEKRVKQNDVERYIRNGWTIGLLPGHKRKRAANV